MTKSAIRAIIIVRAARDCLLYRGSARPGRRIGSTRQSIAEAAPIWSGTVRVSALGTFPTMNASCPPRSGCPSVTERLVEKGKKKRQRKETKEQRKKEQSIDHTKVVVNRYMCAQLDQPVSASSNQLNSRCTHDDPPASQAPTYSAIGYTATLCIKVTVSGVSCAGRGTYY